MKKQSDLSRLMGYAGNYRYFTHASWVLSAVSALVALVPFVYIWKILRDVLNQAVADDMSDKSNTVVCPNCHAQCNNDMKFCGNCGTKLK